jgi:hypothetical protein
MARRANLPEDDLIGECRELARLQEFRPLDLPGRVSSPWRTGVILRDRADVVRTLTVHSLTALHLMSFGPRVIERLEERAAAGLPAAGDVVESIPGSTLWDGGSVYLDLRAQAVSVSQKSAVTHDPRLEAWVRERWPRWEVCVHQLGLPEQLARAGMDPWGWLAPVELERLVMAACAEVPWRGVGHDPVRGLLAAWRASLVPALTDGG